MTCHVVFRKMSNPYAIYYVNQAGSGISGYSGVRYQRGRGFFSKLWSSALLPFLKHLGQSALTTGYDIAKDAVAGKNLKDVFREHLVEAGANLADKGIKRARQYGQTGQGQCTSRKKVTKKKQVKVITTSKKNVQLSRKKPDKPKTNKNNRYTSLNL